MPAAEFYLHLVLSFIAHLDACIHHHVYSEFIEPISLGQLFMQKLHPDKWQYDTKTQKYNLTNKNGSPFTCTSRSFIELLQTVFYFKTEGKMPESLYGIDKSIDWQINDPDGELEDFLRRKKEGSWISLTDVFWLAGMEECAKDKSNKTLVDWQMSMIKHIKTEDIKALGGIAPNAESIIWFIYAFFQNSYEQTDKHNKAYKNKSCVIYDDYYDLWASITGYYEHHINDGVKAKRVEWSAHLKKQATRFERMA